MRSYSRRFAAFVAAALCAASVRADLVSSNDTVGITAGGSIAGAGGTCPDGRTAVAAGFDSDGLNLVWLQAMIPVLPFPLVTPLAAGAGSYVTQPLFWVNARNTAPADHLLVTASVCAPFAATTIVGNGIVVPVTGSGAERVACPEGTFASGGGIDMSNSELFVSSNAPVLDDGSADGARITAVPDGPAAAPIGWRATARFPDPPVLESVAQAAVVCVATPLATQIASITVPGGGQDSTRALCPAGTVAYGGGVDDDGVGATIVTATAPVFDDGTANGQRLVFRPAGIDAAPIGWFGSIRNDDTSDHVLKVAAICPEPIAGELGLAALSALLVARRTRRA